jgi:transitional endoplasmic reticulum ATPase
MEMDDGFNDIPDASERDSASTVPKPNPLVRLWILRLLVRMNCYRAFVRSRDFSDDDIATALGFGRLVNLESDEFSRKTVMANLRAQHERAEAERSKARPPVILARNVKRLAKLLELTPDDCRVLEFAVVINNDATLDNACDLLGHSLSTPVMIRALSRILDLPLKRVEAVVNPNGILSRSGILSVNRNGGGTLSGKLDLLSTSLADRMLSIDADPVELLRGTVALAPAPQLALSDYGHVAASLGLLKPYLKVSLSEGRRGVNIFLHGPPGTGKTQLARRLAHDLRSDLFEVSSENEDGDPVDGEHRLRAYRAAQTLLSKRRSLILFDEVEDVFNDGSEFFGRKSTAQTRKAWMNRMLEDAPVPTFWLSNSIAHVDPAFLRRFDMVIEVPIPPRSQRQRIVERACGDLVGARCVVRISESEHLAPALVSRAASVVRALGRNAAAVDAENALEHLISNTLEAQGHERLLRHDPTRLPDTYNLAFLNPDADIHAIACGLQEAKSGRLCLYGPPGTGKTAFGRWLAQQLDMPLQVRRASDLLSPYIGMTEKNLARAFREAEQEGALLMIDEIDSFLRDRAEAQRPWEVTQVNEMLTQMEAFPGLFVASTNLMDGLDPAALRRFDAKVRLGYLRPEQAVALLKAHCQDLGLGTPDPIDERAVARLDRLAPGDFASLVRQNRFRPIGSAGELVRLLGAEVGLKGGGRRPVGFMPESGQG